MAIRTAKIANEYNVRFLRKPGLIKAAAIGVSGENRKRKLRTPSCCIAIRVPFKCDPYCRGRTHAFPSSAHPYHSILPTLLLALHTKKAD